MTCSEASSALGVVPVTLTHNNRLRAAWIGCKRRIESKKDGRGDDFGFRKQGEYVLWDWHMEIDGAGGELAFCQWRGMVWNEGVNTFKLGDAGPYQIRTVAEPHKRLLVRPQDHLDEPYIHVVGAFPAYRLQGWMWGHEVKSLGTQQRFNGGPPCWVVQSSRLHDLGTLPSLEKLGWVG